MTAHDMRMRAVVGIHVDGSAGWYFIIGDPFHQLAALQYELAIFERSANSYTCAAVCPTSSTAGLYSLQNCRRMHPGKRSLKGKAAKACLEILPGGGGRHARITGHSAL